MGVWNGGANLVRQLESIAAQDHPDWVLVVSDDGSTDGSQAVVAGFAARFPPGRVRTIDGPRRGFAANYLGLLAAVAPAPGWLAFADQDDLWLPDRLSRGLAALAGGTGPALYCSRTWVTDAALAGRRLSPPRPRPPGFANALTQNIAAGNTILLDPAAAALLAGTAGAVPGVVAHDWWAYLAVTGAGGRVVHDDAPTLLYRQHPGNAIGANEGWRARARRLGMVVQGTFRGWNDTNAAALAAIADRLAPGPAALLARWQAMRAARPLPRRLWLLARLGLYRQTRAGTAALWFAAILGRI